MLTVMYDDDMPSAEELEALAGTLAEGGEVAPADAERLARVIREVATALRRTQVVERVSDEGFD